MNGFERKKITKFSPAERKKIRHHIFAAVGVLFILFFLFQAGARVIDGLSGTKAVRFITSFLGRDLLVDEDGHTNILLLGVGGKNHDGGTLTDSIMIGSINYDDNQVAMLSIPRDLYIDSSLGAFRVNQLFEEASSRWDELQGLDFVRETLQEILDIPLHYVVKVDFRAAEAVVDAVGGIDVYVHNTINDPLYPKDGTYEYEPFYLERGLRHLDGKTALKYARSRKTSSDFDRSRRQQQVLVALKQKALEKNILKRASRLKDIYYSLSEHIVTNMSIREMLSLGDFAASWDSKNISSTTLNDESLFTGGFLYPPLRSLYGGAYVLVPAGDNFDSVRQFARLILYGPPHIDDYPVMIFNGTKTNGYAGRTRLILNRFGPQIQRVANGRDNTLIQTSWYAQDQASLRVAKALTDIIPGEVTQEIPPEYEAIFLETPNAIILELGSDSEAHISKLDVFRNIVELKPTPAPAEDASATAADETENT